ncbi:MULTISPECIES: DUF166 domain-containing protein [Methanobacterium]|jgi:hypothetical protein|uniref:DUF166 family protein n=1 Tax=Methanobacterium veterum TaxID=408577 RepID=A0A9E5A6Z7_9EURY|nr:MULTISPECIES: DUF166 family protein [Methanobacterium]MCZ3367176.1 DUF166 family protein [Methanobacterium veterum]MCZ3373676.1 DUF166 family protein [Methanobacterium veterum]
MLKVVIATDGPYGERAFENIKKDFDTEFIELEQPTSMFMDEIDIPADALAKIKQANILITYTQHPDLTLDLVDMVNKDVDYIIVAAWKGEGFKNQLEGYENVTCPYIMCELEENGNEMFDEFTSKIGKPKVNITLEDGKIAIIDVIRSSPCGSTTFVADYISDKYFSSDDLENIPTEAGLKLQHYPCRAAKMRLFSDEECKKEMASGFHKDAFEEGIKRGK